MAAASFAALLDRRRHPRHRTPGGAARLAPHAASLASVSSPPLSAIVQQMLTGEQQRDRGGPRPPGRARDRRARLVQRGGRGGDQPKCGGSASAPASDLVDGSGLSPQDAIAPATLVKVIELAIADSPAAAAAGRPAGGGFFRHAVRRAERVQRDRRGGARLGTGQDRQPRHRDGPGRDGVRRQRHDAGLRLHGRPDSGRGDAGAAAAMPSTRPRPRWPAAGAGDGRCRHHVRWNCEQHADD